MQGNPVVWFEIYVRDMKRAKAFYQGVLGVQFRKLESPADDMMEMWAFPSKEDSMGSSGALTKMQGEQPSGNGTIVYFSCEDCAVEEKRVVPNGGKVMKSKFSIGQYGAIALVTDPDGNVIGLHSMH